MNTKQTTYVPTLDGWRAIAILGVIACHAGDALFFQISPTMHQLTRYGALGVDLFFGISGYLICTRLLQEQAAYGRISPRRFYVRRAFRILPAFWLYLLAVAVGASLGLWTLDRGELTSSMLFVRNYFDSVNTSGWYTAHIWSLSVEEHFYLLWPLSLILLLRIQHRRAPWLIAGVCLLLACWRFVEFRHQWLGSFLPNAGFSTRTDIRLDALLWGCCAALLAWRHRKGLTPACSFGPWLLLLAAFVWCVWFQPPLALIWQSMIIALLIVGTSIQSHWTISRFLERKSIRWVGRLSYGLYLWQQMFLLSRLEPRPLGHLQQWPWNVAAVFGCAIVSYYFVERPLIALGHRLTKHRQRPRAGANVASTWPWPVSKVTSSHIK